MHLPTCARFTKLYKACKNQAPRVQAHMHLDDSTLSVCAHAGVCSGPHCTHCDVCAGPGRCHLQAVWPGHGCQGSSAPADPPAGSTCPVWTPVLPGHGVLLQPLSLCIYQRSNDEHLANSTFFVPFLYTQAGILCTQACQGNFLTLHGCLLLWFDRKSGGCLI